MDFFSDGSEGQEQSFTSGAEMSNDFEILSGYGGEYEEEGYQISDSDFDIYQEILEEIESIKEGSAESTTQEQNDDVVVVLTEIKDILVALGENDTQEETEEGSGETTTQGAGDQENAFGDQERDGETTTEEATEPVTDDVTVISSDVGEIKDKLNEYLALQSVAWSDARLYYKLQVGLSAVLIGIIVTYMFIGRIK